MPPDTEATPLFVAEPEATEAPAAEPEALAAPVAEEAPPPPAPEVDPAKRAMEDLSRREQQLLQRERQIASLSRAKQAIDSGDHRKAAEALGLDVHKLLADVWGQDMLPEQKKPTVDDEVLTVKQQLEQTRKELQQTRGQMARYQIYSRIGGEVSKREDLEIVRYLANEGGEPFYDQLIDYAIEQEQATGTRPNWGEVLEHAEKVYEDRYCSLADSMVKLNKIKSRFGLNEQPQQAKKPVPPKPAARKTLSNALNTDPPKQIEQPKTATERRAAALKAIKDGYARGKAQEESTLEIT